MRTKRISVIILRAVVLSIAAAVGATATQYHVAVSGFDSNAGTSQAPFRTISKAATVMQAGDTCTVHAGTYRERVTPPRGGTSSARIVYQAAAGEAVAIKGSEQITTWTLVSGTTWSVTLPAGFFGTFNPYTLNVSGSYFNGTYCHLGCVYLNDEAFVEKQTLADVQAPNQWCTAQSSGSTVIYANFGAANPNTQQAEINVRPTVFFPTAPATVSYVTVQGFTISQAATNWAAPDAGIQEGAIGSLGGGFWIIQNCTIRYSRNVGISFGAYTGTSYSGSTNMAQIGHHLVRNCRIQRCAEAGIAGWRFPAASRFVGNLIDDVNYLNEWTGAEQANIKFHTTCDVVIEGNLLRQNGTQVNQPIWVDFANTNTRITRNIIVGFPNTIAFEEDHGPFLIDNNILVGGHENEWSTRGVVGAHNLCVNVSDPWVMTDASRSPQINAPHTVSSNGSAVVSASYDDKRYNNVYITNGTGVGNGNGGAADYNLYLAGATRPWNTNDTHGQENSLDPHFSYVSDAKGFAMSWNPGNTLDLFTVPLLTSNTWGVFQPVGMRVENPDGSTITLDHDFFNNVRNSANPRVGPFATGTVMTNQLIFDASTVGALPMGIPTSATRQVKNASGSVAAADRAYLVMGNGSALQKRFAGNGAGTHLYDIKGQQINSARIGANGSIAGNRIARGPIIAKGTVK